MSEPGLHPEFERHGSFAHLKLGRNKRAGVPRVRLADYVDDELLPAAPASVDYTAGVASWPMYGNDRLGDCTCAAAGHMVQAWTAAAGDARTPADADVEYAYIPGTGSADDGRDEQQVLEYWRTVGIGGDLIDAYAYIDPSNLQHLQLALWLFGGVYAGIELPLTAQGQSVWDVVPGLPAENWPGTWGGHAVPYVAYNAAGFTVVTWGGLLRMTGAFHDAYCDEIWAVVSKDFLTGQGVTPAGFALEQLEADLTELVQGE